MNISILTLFPELYSEFLKASIIGKAQDKNKINAELVNFIDFCNSKERVDSPTFGPGPGMLIRPEVVESAVTQQEQKFGSAFKIFFSPHGKKLDQNLLKELSAKLAQEKHIMLLASRYEGMDARVEEYYADEIISLGDFVLMGGDLPAMCFLEGFLRLIPGVVGNSDSIENDSFSGPLVDHPEYTSPLEFKGLQVPEVIRSGNHALIHEYRQKKAIERTLNGHFNWLRSQPLTKELKAKVHKEMPTHYAVLMHGDILLKDKTVGTSSVTSLDIHDIARSAMTYGIKNYYIVTPLKDQQTIVQTLLDFWNIGHGIEYNIHRHNAIKMVRLNNNLDEVLAQIEKTEGQKPLLIATSAKYHNNTERYITYFDQAKVWKSKRPVLFIFGTGHGLADYILDRCDFILEPLHGFSEFNHLSVRSAAAVIFDKWFGVNLKK
ncbi:MAG: tRNA (guanosine(37)-N1)-methyltransferase TrmD [Candidatus Babeliales bacterium]|nr:tRNA (guanosine(37)-N1)-methyltransferase TrmD [Candidatus Babeliales bacterium]